MGRRGAAPEAPGFPLIVKSLTEDASLGISQASVVEDDEKLQERVAFIHESLGTDAIAERYIEGRELYVGVIGNHRLQVLPVWELRFGRPARRGRPDRDRAAQVEPAVPEEARHHSGARRAACPSRSAGGSRHLAKRIYRTLGSAATRASTSA